MSICNCICILLLFVGLSHCELYTALADLEGLLTTEGVIIDSLEKYIRIQEEKILILRK